jgi:hypothetical protein
MFYAFRSIPRDAINSSARSTFFDRVPLGSAPSAYASVAPLLDGSLPDSAFSLGTTAWCLCGPLRGPSCRTRHDAAILHCAGAFTQRST